MANLFDHEHSSTPALKTTAVGEVAAQFLCKFVEFRSF